MATLGLKKEKVTDLSYRVWAIYAETVQTDLSECSITINDVEVSWDDYGEDGYLIEGVGTYIIRVEALRSTPYEETLVIEGEQPNYNSSIYKGENQVKKIYKKKKQVLKVYKQNTLVYEWNGEIPTPSETYTFYSWMKSTGGYIITDDIGNNNQKFEIQYAEGQNTSYSAFLSMGRKTFNQGLTLAESKTGNSIKFAYINTSALPRGTYYKQPFVIPLNTNGSWNGVDTSPLIVFNTITDDVVGAVNTTVTIYYIKIYENDVLIKHYIPASDGASNGLYDLVTDTFVEATVDGFTFGEIQNI